MGAPEHYELTDRDRAILDFESSWPGGRAGKEATVRAVFELRFVRYHQLLNRIIHSQAGLLYNPMLIKRLLRLQDERLEVRYKHQSAPRSNR